LEIVTSRQDHEIVAKVEIPAERVEQLLRDITQEFADHIHIPGFRKGHAPLNLVRTHVGDDRIRDEALDKLMDEAMDGFNAQEKVEPLFAPRVKVDSFKKGEPLTLTITVDPWPMLELPPLGDLELHLEEPRVGEMDVEEAIQRLRSSYAEYRTKESQITAMGDTAVIKWKIEEKAAWRNAMIELGQEQLVPGFDEQLVGLSVGTEKVFDLSVQDSLLHFIVQLVEVKEKILPTEDAAFAAHFGLETMDEVHIKVEGELRESAESQYQSNLRDGLVHHYLEIIPLSFSEYAEGKALENYLASYQEHLKKRGRTFMQVLSELGLKEEEWKASVGRKTAVDLLKEQVVLSEIARQHNLDVSQEEIKTERSDQPGTDHEDAVHALRRRKALDWLVAEWKAARSAKLGTPQEP
jgi:trigger factor